jgi:hypothetical protein
MKLVKAQVITNYVYIVRDDCREDVIMGLLTDAYDLNRFPPTDERITITEVKSFDDIPVKWQNKVPLLGTDSDLVERKYGKKVSCADIYKHLVIEQLAGLNQGV